MDVPPATLRTETEALCLDIEKLNRQLKAMAFDDAKQLWEATYRPKARSFAEAMLSYAANDDPRIHVEMRVGNARILKASVLACIEAPFSEQTAWAHLDTVTRELRGLMNDLSTETNA